jgi:hypothetical protein
LEGRPGPNNRVSWCRRGLDGVKATAKRKGQTAISEPPCPNNRVSGWNRRARGPENNVLLSRSVPVLESSARARASHSSLKRTKHPPIASWSHRRQDTQRLPLVTGIFFLGTREQHSSLTPQAHWKKEIVLGDYLRCIIRHTGSYCSCCAQSRPRPVLNHRQMHFRLCDVRIAQRRAVVSARYEKLHALGIELGRKWLTGGQRGLVTYDTLRQFSDPNAS